MNRIIYFYLLLLFFLSSCSSTQRFSSHGAGRVKKYDFFHKDIPTAFDGFRIAFISDLHYKSTLQEAGLDKLVRQLQDVKADVLLMGGDYQEGCDVVPELFDKLSAVKTKFGTIGVMGNNDYERCHDEIVREMHRHGMKVLEHQLDTLNLDSGRIILAGVRNPFDLKRNGVSPTLSLSAGDFVILLTHTPDYAEEVPITNSDLVLAGHTHGGQVTLFGLYAPIIPSAYGQHFRTGLKYTSAHIPVIVTNGIGTSRKRLRLFAPSEIVVIVLHKQ
nr:metallophosphoesterase [Bacteroides ihuae]